MDHFLYGKKRKEKKRKERRGEKRGGEGRGERRVPAFLSNSKF